MADKVEICPIQFQRFRAVKRCQLRLVALLEQSHQLLDRRRRLARRLERIADVIDRLHPNQRHVHAGRRAHELNRALRIGRETAERIGDDRRQSAR